MKKVSLFIASFFIGAIGISQITYEASDYATAGYSMKQSRTTLNMSSFDFSTTGTNYVWNFSSLQKEENEVEEVLSGNNSGYQAAFIGQCILGGGNPITCNSTWNDYSDQARLLVDSLDAQVFTIYDVTTIMSFDGNDLIANVQGAKVDDTSGNRIPITSEYSDKDTVYNFPLSFGNTFISHGTWEIDMNPVGFDLRVVANYDRNYEVDGWGSLITPYKYHNDVLRVRTQIDEIDSVYFNGFPFAMERVIVQYSWFDLNYGLPVMEAIGQINNNVELINSVTYLDSTDYSSIQENKVFRFNIFPNPAQEFITISSDKNRMITSIKVMTLEGKEVLRTPVRNDRINISSLKKGTYLIGLYNENKAIGIKKFTKN